MKQNKIIWWILLIILVLGLTFYSLGYRITKVGGRTSENSLGNIPAECQPPSGQDLQSWKEHLGHHQETKYCLKYF